MSQFVEVARDAFEFLTRKYGFSFVECSGANGGGHVTYVNTQHGVAVKAMYEVSSAFVFVFIYRLIDGELRENSLPITDQSEINCIDFNDVLPEAQKMKPAYEYGDHSPFYDEQFGLQNFVREFATRLDGFGGPLLGGNFSVMAQVAEVIRRRAEALKLQ